MILPVAFLIVGCTTQMPKMINSDSNANYDKDHYECLKEAEKMVEPDDSAYDNMMRTTRVKDKTVLCMKARGWNEVKDK